MCVGVVAAPLNGFSGFSRSAFSYSVGSKEEPFSISEKLKPKEGGSGNSHSRFCPGRDALDKFSESILTYLRFEVRRVADR